MNTIKEQEIVLLQKGIAALESDQIPEASACFNKAMQLGNMKAGRYLAVIALKEAAERGDITSKLMLGTLYEFGYAVSNDTEKAKALYRSALADNHENREKDHKERRHNGVCAVRGQRCRDRADFLPERVFRLLEICGSGSSARRERDGFDA